MMEPADYTGAVYIADTTQYTGKFWAVTALEASVLNVASVADYRGSGIGALPIPVGTTIYGNFSRIQLTSGKVLAYSI
jgi:hypothetical protein